MGYWYLDKEYSRRVERLEGVVLPRSMRIGGLVRGRCGVSELGMWS